MDALILERLVKERQRELLDAAPRQRLVGPNRLGAYGVVVRLLDAIRASQGRVHETLGDTTEVGRSW